MDSNPRRRVWTTIAAVVGFCASLITINEWVARSCTSQARVGEGESEVEDDRERSGATSTIEIVAPASSGSATRTSMPSAAVSLRSSTLRSGAATIRPADASAATRRPTTRVEGSALVQDRFVEAEFIGRELFFSPAQRAMLLREPRSVRDDVLRHYPVTEAR